MDGVYYENSKVAVVESMACTLSGDCGELLAAI
jgi:hypothetical protein